MQNWEVGTWNGEGKRHNMMVPFYRLSGAAEVFIVRILAVNAGVLEAQSRFFSCIND